MLHAEFRSSGVVRVATNARPTRPLPYWSWKVAPITTLLPYIDTLLPKPQSDSPPQDLIFPSLFGRRYQLEVRLPVRVKMYTAPSAGSPVLTLGAWVSPTAIVSPSIATAIPKLPVAGLENSCALCDHVEVRSPGELRVNTYAVPDAPTTIVSPSIDTLLPNSATATSGVSLSACVQSEARLRVNTYAAEAPSAPTTIMSPSMETLPPNFPFPAASSAMTLARSWIILRKRVQTAGERTPSSQTLGPDAKYNASHVGWHVVPLNMYSTQSPTPPLAGGADALQYLTQTAGVRTPSSQKLSSGAKYPGSHAG
mmetsp:Transcript_11768/g.53140  ORF Transcript_11768/g.53140 Transcript_11768/m.53140 type:complete len:311 (-) Transcript_11768:1139-2071(-)